MASIRANLLMALLRSAPYAGTSPDPRRRAKQLEQSRRVIRLITMPQPPGTRRVDAKIPGVKAEWHIGKNVRDDARIVYFHGGGYGTGSSTTHRHFTSVLAKETGLAVLSVDYRLAPEHPYPAAQDDAALAYAWAAENGPFGASRARFLCIGGDSAGGGLTLSVAMRLRDAGQLLPGALILLSPWLDLRVQADSIRRLGALDVMLTAAQARVWVENYAAGQDVTTPGISPLFGDFSGLPPMFFTVAGREILLDDALAGIEKAKAAGVATELDRHEEMFHVWPIFFHLIPEGRASLTKIVAFIRRQLLQQQR